MKNMYEYRKSKEDEKTRYDDQEKKLKVKLSPKASKEKKAKKQTKDQSMFILSLDPYEKPLKWWENEHVKYAINYKPVKSRVQELMGSNIIHLTDREYMKIFTDNIRKSYRDAQLSRIEKKKEWVKSMFGSFILKDNI